MAITVHQAFIDQLTNERNSLRANVVSLNTQVTGLQQTIESQTAAADDMDTVLTELVPQAQQ